MDKNNRGRAATKPTQIPWKGLLDVCRRVYGRLANENLSLICAGVAFYATLAIFPALAAIVTLYALVADPIHIIQHFQLLSGFLPDDVRSIFTAQFTDLATEDTQSLGIKVVFGFILAVWLAQRGMGALIHTITLAYNETESRSFLHLTVLSYFLTFGAIILVVLLMIGMIGIPLVFSFNQLSTLATAATITSSWILFTTTSIMTVGILYRYAAPRRPAQWRWLSAGTVFSTTAWLAGSVGFSFYVSQFGNYNETYGSLSAVAVLLLWFYISTFIITFGALLNAELEHQTKRDTTIGPERPMGERGAHVADTLGRSF